MTFYIILLLVCAIIVLLVKLDINQTDRKEDSLKLKSLRHDKKSLETIYGYAVENLTPHLKELSNHNLKSFRQLGSPIDYIYFGDDVIEFIEVKSGESRLSGNQKRIKKLVKDGKVRFREVRVERK